MVIDKISHMVIPLDISRISLQSYIFHIKSLTFDYTDKKLPINAKDPNLFANK
jgi:hypothetical protein